MQFSYAAVAAALVASATAAVNGTAVSSAVWVTDVVTAYTTVCPASTQLTFNGVTYTATKSQTLTITNCPCTVSKLSTITPVVSMATSKPVYANSTVAVTTAPAVVPVTSAATKTAVGTTSAAATKSAAATFTGAANRVAAGSAAGLAGLLGLAAYVL